MRVRRLATPLVLALVLAACSGTAAVSPETVPTPSAPLPPASAPIASAVTAAPTPAPTPVPTPDRPGFGEPVGQVRCDYGGHDGSYHIHATIRIFVDGVETDPDNDVGVDQTRCMYWVHTHDGTGGVVHVEAPENVVVTLGDFMDVWKASYPTSPVFQAALAQLDAGGVTVDGKVPFGEWRGVVLADGIRIEVR